MSRSKLCFIIAGILVLPGCVSSGTHETTVAELEASRKASAETSAAFEAYKKKTTGELEGLKEENTRLSNELLAAQTKVGQQQEKLDLVAKNLDATLASERTLETETANLRREASGDEDIRAGKAAGNRRRASQRAESAPPGDD